MRTQSVIVQIRASTHYKEARSGFALPFRISAILLFAAGALMLLGAITGTFKDGFYSVVVAGFTAVGCFIAGGFLLGVSNLAQAIFDIADCSITERLGAAYAPQESEYSAPQVMPPPGRSRIR